MKELLKKLVSTVFILVMMNGWFLNVYKAYGATNIHEKSVRSVCAVLVPIGGLVGYF